MLESTGHVQSNFSKTQPCGADSSPVSELRAREATAFSDHSHKAVTTSGQHAKASSSYIPDSPAIANQRVRKCQGPKKSTRSTDSAQHNLTASLNLVSQLEKQIKLQLLPLSKETDMQTTPICSSKSQTVFRLIETEVSDPTPADEKQ